MEKFSLTTEKRPAGDQGQAIVKLTDSIKNKTKYNILLGATGTGKTFTIANVIKNLNKPTLVLAHNKTLANQLYVEFKELFPSNRIEYYISNFDFYQPEAYLPKKDLYVEKRSVQNWQIEMMRNSTLNALTSQNDVIVVASVAAIYGHREPSEYKKHHFEISLGNKITRKEFLTKIVSLGYKRGEDLFPGSFILRGDVVELVPAWSDQFNIRIDFFGDEITEIVAIDSLKKTIIERYNHFTITPADANVVSSDLLKNAIVNIKKDLEKRIKYFEEKNLLLEKQRIENRTNYDLEQLREFGITSGIENYSIYFEPWRKHNEPPATLFSYFPKDYLLIVDESHITIPQIGGMYEGDYSRKKSLVEYGFRLPSALDNRPLRFHEFEDRMNQVIFVSATPGDYELKKTKNQYVEQIIRPTGLLDPIIEIKNVENQLEDIANQIRERKKNNERVFVNTITKKLAEDIAKYLTETEFSVAYLHSDLKTFEREEVIRKLRVGFYDAIVGINLLREGLDVPEVSLIVILDADKDGFLRNKRSLIQMIGRVARNVNGKAILYAKKITNSMQGAIDETNRRRAIQLEFNKKHHITPVTIKKTIPQPLIKEFELDKKLKLSSLKSKQKIAVLEKEMKKAAKEYDFERAIKLRDLITELKSNY
ncbi:excinuclease ABC subunit UvrB [Candidatus Hepatoplasma crinochetorum]|uniref:UvrABC system protein B n=1 Tax=Candidatus Hepatoplasma crinochetorum Av TaxID=1427984 RepID=W8GT64_9MOLU|nr:excinuclease ABC subunit UvrB [Candidatus Hepatoplasma crinochetorum]AHK22620.1 Excinuclease ABC subunit B [Candidatus Hepatoplasma crinochetorum Av]BDV03202.1 MAG: UvrABC system protein B [Candidatus Hepatoplasma crinochetorum]